MYKIHARAGRYQFDMVLNKTVSFSESLDPSLSYVFPSVICHADAFDDVIRVDEHGNEVSAISFNTTNMRDIFSDLEDEIFIMNNYDASKSERLKYLLEHRYKTKKSFLIIGQYENMPSNVSIEKLRLIHDECTEQELEDGLDFKYHTEVVDVYNPLYNSDCIIIDDSIGSGSISNSSTSGISTHYLQVEASKIVRTTEEAIAKGFKCIGIAMSETNALLYEYDIRLAIQLFSLKYSGVKIVYTMA